MIQRVCSRKLKAQSPALSEHDELASQSIVQQVHTGAYDDAAGSRPQRTCRWRTESRSVEPALQRTLIRREIGIAELVGAGSSRSQVFCW